MPGRHRKPPSPRRPGRHRKPPHRSRWAVPALTGVVALGFGGIAAAAVFTGGNDQATATALHPHVVMTTRPASPAAPSPETHVAAVHIHPAALSITALGRMSWVEVAIRGRGVVFQGLLRHGRTLTFRAHPLSVVIGDAGAVGVVIHGHRHHPAGRRGQVLVLHVS